MTFTRVADVWHLAPLPVPSPFTTYAMHPIEALMLGSILLPALLAFDLHLTSIVAYPVASLLLNTLGHMNYTFDGVLARFATAHLEHHTKNRGGYGFIIGAFESPRVLRLLRR